MEIMQFVKDNVKGKTLSFYLCVFLTMEIAIVLIACTVISGPMPYQEEDLIWQILWVGSQVLIIYIWFYYAPIVYKDLRRLKGAFYGMKYYMLYTSFRLWLNQRNFKYGGKNRIFKCIYVALWSFFTLELFIFIMFYLVPGSNPFFTVASALLSLLLTGTVIFLNFSSYYICIMFVYFLMRLYKLEHDAGLEHVDELPSVTHGFQVLLKTADTIYLYFLMDSFLCTVAFFALWKLMPKGGLTGKGYLLYVRSDFLYLTMFLIVCGLGTWIFIVLVSRAYLRRLHYEWVYKSSMVLRKTYRAALGTPKEQAVIDKKCLYEDKISITGWNLLISLATLAADLFTAWSIFSNIII